MKNTNNKMWQNEIRAQTALSLVFFNFSGRNEQMAAELKKSDKNSIGMIYIPYFLKQYPEKLTKNVILKVQKFE